MNYFNYIPNEIIEIIFKKLNLNDLRSVKNVDKRFKSICDQFKTKELYVSNPVDYYSKYWHFTNDFINPDEDNFIRFHKFLKYITIFNLNSTLKRLYLEIKTDFNLSNLNIFTSLEHLAVCIRLLSYDNVFSSESLRIAEINIGLNDGCKIILETPKLFAFKSISGINDFNFNYPDRILSYETDCYYYDEINIFTNLERLKLNEGDDIMDREILIKFRNLKVIDLNVNFSYFEDNEILENFKNDLSFIIFQKNLLGRPDFEFYLQGVHLINENIIHQFKLTNDPFQNDFNSLQFQIENINLLKDNCWKSNKINYNDLIKLIKIVSPSFINKFSTLNEILANEQIPNEYQFIQFLYHLIYLSKLELINCGLSKSFYDTFINLNNLFNLNIMRIEEKIEIGIDFDFILYLKQLKKFHTNQILPVDLVCKLLIKNRKLQYFRSKLDNNNFIEINQLDGIYNACSYYFDVKQNVNFLVNNLKLEDLILGLKNLRM